jgi:hypothetical protein
MMPRSGNRFSDNIMRDQWTERLNLPIYGARIGQPCAPVSDVAIMI